MPRLDRARGEQHRIGAEGKPGAAEARGILHRREVVPVGLIAELAEGEVAVVPLGRLRDRASFGIGSEAQPAP